MEFNDGIFKTLKDLAVKSESITLALIYTCGHIIISMTVVSLMTGASLWEAGSVALVEPAINGVWFFILHKLWKKFA